MIGCRVPASSQTLFLHASIGCMQSNDSGQLQTKSLFCLLLYCQPLLCSHGKSSHQTEASVVEACLSQTVGKPQFPSPEQFRKLSQFSDTGTAAGCHLHRGQGWGQA